MTSAPLTTPDRGDGLRQQLRAIWRYKWVVLACTLACMLLALAAGYLGGPRYVSTAEVLVRTTSTTPFDSSDASKQISMQTEVQVAESEKVATVVAKQVGSDQSADDLVKNLRVTNPTNTTVLRFQYEDGSAQRAQKLANSFATAYLSDRESRTLGTVNRLVKVLEDQASTLDDRRAELDKAIAAASNETARASLEAQRTLVLNEALAIRSRLVEARTLDTTPGDVVRTATVPKVGSGPATSTLLVMGFLAGLVVGVGVAWILSIVRRPAGRQSDAAAATGSAVLATLQPRRGNRHRTAAQVAAEQPSAEAKALAVGVAYGDVVGGARVLLVVGARVQAPATQTAVELGCALAQMGRSVAIFEADLRRPSIMTALGLTADEQGTEAGWPAVRGVGMPGLANLAVFPGRVTESPLEVLAGADIHRTLKDLREQFAFVLVLTPPVLDTVDGLELAHLVDGVLIAAPEKVRPEDLRSAAEAVGHAGGPVVGTILAGR